MKLKKKINCEKEEKKNSGQLGLTFQTCDPSRDDEIIS
jgi:hypothetical protein